MHRIKKRFANFRVIMRSAAIRSETLVIHVESVSISGGYLLEWDRNPVCIGIEDIQLIEDGGGVLLPLSVTCTDDLTPGEDLIVSAFSSRGDIVSVYS